jgi:hypothetical protein
MLKERGIELIAADNDAFLDDGPTATLIRQVLGAVSQFEKAMLVSKLRGARERKRLAIGKCEGRKSHAELSPEMVQIAKGCGGASVAISCGPSLLSWRRAVISMLTGRSSQRPRWPRCSAAEGNRLAKPKRPYLSGSNAAICGLRAIALPRDRLPFVWPSLWLPRRRRTRYQRASRYGRQRR